MTRAPKLTTFAIAITMFSMGGCDDTSTSNTTTVQDVVQDGLADGVDASADLSPTDQKEPDTSEADLDAPGDGGEDTSTSDADGDTATDDADTTADVSDADIPPEDVVEPECVDNDGCVDGACIDGACCAEASACAGVCCGESEVCFANTCVEPGDACRTTDDCGENQYCEPALGDPPPTPNPDPGQVCLGAAPGTGRCVTLPPPCAGPEPMPGEDCVPVCEFRPAVGRLHATEEWSWGLDGVNEFPTKIDVWATPAVGRLTDTNCDGKVDAFDPPNVVFVSGDSRGTCCSCGAGNTETCKTGVLRVLDGASGTEVFSIEKPNPASLGFAGLSVALGDLDHDGHMEIVTVSGEGHIVIVDRTGTILAESTDVIDAGWLSDRVTGWGGALTLGDMNHDGVVEIAYGRVIFSAVNDAGTWTIPKIMEGTLGWGRNRSSAISSMVNLDDDADLELLAGRTAYKFDGSALWDRNDLPAGYSAAADFDLDGLPDVVHVGGGRVHLLNGMDGTDKATALPASGATPGNGGPPTIADFDNDFYPEIGVAYREFYEVIDLDAGTGQLTTNWSTQNHDLSSSVTGSTVFDFEGDGFSEVIYNDECFLWVYDGTDGSVRFADFTSSFTATEASLVADIDADGSAEIVMIANSASPRSWRCTDAQWTTRELSTTSSGVTCTNDTDCGADQACQTNTNTNADECYDIIRPGWVGSDGAEAAYRGIKVFRDVENSWVGTRTLWNQHAYSVSNICGDNGACAPGSTYGDIPKDQVSNWDVPFLNNFRQNIQGSGIFDAPDATIAALTVSCDNGLTLIASVRNFGQAILPAGVNVGFFVEDGAGGQLVGSASTTSPLFPGQVARLEVDVTLMGNMSLADKFFARILIDPDNRTFRECREENNESERVVPESVCLN